MSKKLLSLFMAALLALILPVPGVLANTGPDRGAQQEQTVTITTNETVTGSVYGDNGEDEDDKRGKKGQKFNNGKHKGVANALTHVKNPRARAVLQAILEGRSVSEAVYQYKMDLSTDIDPDEVQTVANEVYGGLSRDNRLSGREKAITFRYMAQIHIKAGNISEALKYMEYSAQSDPADDETFKELDRIHAGKRNMAVKVYINGKNTDFDVLPKIVEGRTLVPVRFIAEGLNANVSYNGDTGTVNIQGPHMSISMKINSRTALVNGREVHLDVPATIENGRTIVPLRFISENFRCKVKFYGESNLVTVTQ